MRRAGVMMASVALASAAFAAKLVLPAQGGGSYRLVPDWPKLPAGMYFGLKDPPPPPAEREALAAARRARGGAPGGGGQSSQALQPGISGLAIDARDHIYVFNRGAKPVMV